MRNNILLKGLVPTLVLFSTQAMAVPFQSFDPRAFGMGGTGTASGTAANAGFMNPALLATANEDEDFALELPVIGGSVYAEDNLLDELDNYQNNQLEANFDQSLTNLKNSPSPTSVEYAAVLNSATALINQLEKISNKALGADFAGGLVIGIPSKKIGASLQANVRLVGGGIINVTNADITQLQSIATQANASTLPQNTVDTFNSTDLTSQLKAKGAVVEEVGVSLAREIEIAGSKVGFGITPKYLKVTTFDYLIDVNTADDFDSDKGKKEYSDFNLDVGIAKDFGNGWKTGLVVKNAISQEYETALAGNKFKLEPQARFGIAHSTDWTTVALDVDLAENEAVGFESKTQYAAFGAELDVFNTIQFRIGYRHNMSDSNTSIATAGLGFSLFGAHTDVAVGANEDEIGASLQLGFRF